MLRPAFLIIAGRMAGFAAAFVTPLILVRIFDLAAFGTYKQWFLLYITILTVTQIGMAESLLYFLPRAGAEAGRYVMNSILFLSITGAAAALLVTWGAGPIARWMNNPALAPLVPMLGLYVWLMQTSVGLETVMTARGSYRSAALAYATSDIVRALFLVVPVLFVPSLRVLLYGAVSFGLLRLLYTLHYFRREFAGAFRPDGACLTRQLGYSLPFALAVLASVVQENFHQYTVAGLFDAATFAIYAVGCLQIPIVDLIGTTICNVMMVGMTQALHAGRETEVIEIWHHTVRKLALVFFPLACVLLVTARDVIVMLFTDSYLASVPVFMVSLIAVVFAALPVDGLLRVYAKTRTLMTINLLRLAMIALLIHWSIASFGLLGAMLVTVAALGAGKAVALGRAASLWRVGLLQVLPWRPLSLVAAVSAAAAVPAFAVADVVHAAPFLRILAAGTVYAGAYAALVTGFGLLSAHERASLFELLERVHLWLPGRYQHKPS
ncbi:MAG TPA: lipopolysaccharide biosynthesis protein [Nitrospira sp.]|nr:lipopolysaccharide biosynthesis protein [Nitrospira sp.]